MIKEDFVIQATVRRLLVRSNIDYSALTFGTVKGVVYFRGLFKLTRIYVADEDERNKDLKSQDFIRKTLHSLEKKVKSVPGVRDVIFQFINWKKERGQWIPVKERVRAVAGAPIPTMEKKAEGKWVLVEKDGEWEVEEEKGEGED
jgi:hypothetical protein